MPATAASAALVSFWIALYRSYTSILPHVDGDRGGGRDLRSNEPTRWLVAVVPQLVERSRCSVRFRDHATDEVLLLEHLSADSPKIVRRVEVLESEGALSLEAVVTVPWDKYVGFMI